MNYSAEINVLGGKEDLFECFKTEEINKERSTYTLKKTKDGVKFNIIAKDATALRATVNMITQLLTVYEKMRLK